MVCDFELLKIAFELKIPKHKLVSCARNKALITHIIHLMLLFFEKCCKNQKSEHFRNFVIAKNYI